MCRTPSSLIRWILLFVIFAPFAESFGQDEKPLTSFQGHAAAVNAAVYTASGRYIVTAGADQLVKIWDAKTGEEIRTLAGHTGQVLSVAISPDDSMIVSAAGDNTLRMWDVPRPEPLRTFAGVASPVRDVAVSLNGQWAATVGDDKAARVWRMEDGNSTLLLEGHAAATIAAAFARTTTNSPRPTRRAKSACGIRSMDNCKRRSAPTSAKFAG